MTEESTSKLLAKIPDMIDCLEQILLRLYALLDGEEPIAGLSDFVHVATFFSHETESLPDIQIIEPAHIEQLERKIVGTWSLDHGKVVICLTGSSLTVDFTDLDGNILEFVG